MQPQTRYAKSADVNVAYQVVGDGPRDLVLVPGWVSHIEYAWEQPQFAAGLRRLASFSRLLFLDRRGTGLSDPVASLPTLEERMDDVRAVMDAAGSQRATLFGISEGGPMCMLFAATYPERTEGLVLYGTFASGTRRDDHPWMPSVEAWGRFLDLVAAKWGTGAVAKILAPSIAADPRLVESWGRFERLAVSPGGARSVFQMVMDCDVRHVLPAIHTPTVVMNRADDAVSPAAVAQYIAGRIEGARYVELPGADHFPWTGDADAILDEVEEFLTGVRRGPDLDRVLATVLFTDIVESTRQAAELGDRRWRELLERYYGIVRGELVRFRGREIDTTGDGLLATFDGPARAVRCACAARDAAARLGVVTRTGLHTGECEMLGDGIGGIAVHLGARVAEAAEPGEVLVSSTVKDLVAGSGLRFVDRGEHTLKGIPDGWRLFRVST